jgi:hypothetical protein
MSRRKTLKQLTQMMLICVPNNKPSMENTWNNRQTFEKVTSALCAIGVFGPGSYLSSNPSFRANENQFAM